jgi:hypothetical protein
MQPICHLSSLSSGVLCLPFTSCNLNLRFICHLSSLSSGILCVHFHPLSSVSIFNLPLCSLSLLQPLPSSSLRLPLLWWSMVKSSELTMYVNPPLLTSHCWQAFWISVRMPAHIFYVHFSLTRSSIAILGIDETSHQTSLLSASQRPDHWQTRAHRLPSFYVCPTQGVVVLARLQSLESAGSDR